MSTPPNILLITTDQQRFDTIHAAGNPHILTPHLNWLMDSGITYTRCYSDSPICMPARATIMTGRHGYRQGLTSNSGASSPIDPASSLPGMLTAAGYQTRAVGKMHFMPNRCHYGFEHMVILEDYYRHMGMQPHRGIPTNHGLGQNEMEPAISTVDETDSLTHWIVDQSIDFLETRDTTRPFFLWTSFSKPHPPWDPCRNYWDLYQDMALPMPIDGDWSRNAHAIPQGFMRPTYYLNGADRFSKAVLAQCKRAYYACITQIDYNLGALFARMREQGLLEQTTIIFTSDHGEMLGDHHMGAKGTFLEGSAHVPMILRPAEKQIREDQRGGTSDTLVCLADILPTCTNIAETPMQDSSDTDGLDLLAAFRNEQKRGMLHGECKDQFCVMEGHYKYMFTSSGAGELLFDLSSDPWEQHELIRTGKHDAVLHHLRAQLLQRLSAAGHPAVQDGKLRSLQEPLRPKEARQHTWPGFHSRIHPDEVLH